MTPAGTLYATVAAARPEKKRAYERPLHAMLDWVPEVGWNASRLFYNAINSAGGRRAR